jgi:hypothetical protein
MNQHTATHTEAPPNGVGFTVFVSKGMTPEQARAAVDAATEEATR